MRRERALLGGLDDHGLRSTEGAVTSGTVGAGPESFDTDALGPGDAFNRTDLRGLAGHIDAGARALRVREHWLARVAHRHVDADLASSDAEVLEQLAAWLRYVEGDANARVERIDRSHLADAERAADGIRRRRDGNAAYYHRTRARIREVAHV